MAHPRGWFDWGIPPVRRIGGSNGPSSNLKETLSALGDRLDDVGRGGDRSTLGMWPPETTQQTENFRSQTNHTTSFSCP